ncbi:helix-turn-helix domain-containing protein [Alkalibacterium gilvum]|uniref:helix-turn-helix domain-containing protein n=1 Tax=Alkalibacterium gilvum TaxID=1130080 RepID=UPI003F8DD387
MKKEIGYKIRQIRKRQNGGKGLSMEEFGKLFDPPASKGVVSNWENNYNYPNEKRLKKLAELGGISVQNLLYGPYSEIMEKIDKEPEKETAESKAFFDREKEKLLNQYYENYHVDLDSRVKISRTILIDFLESQSNSPSFKHSVMLLEKALRYAFIHETNDEEDPTLIRFLEDIISNINDYSTNDKSLSQYTDEEIRNNIVEKIDYILSNAKKENN